jgi:hypothetical protein
VHRLRCAVTTAVALTAFASGLVASPASGLPRTLQARIGALATSPAGRAAQAEWDRGVRAGDIGKLTKSVAVHYHRVTTPFQQELLAAGQLATAPATRELLSSLKSQRRLHPVQARALVELLRAIDENPAVDLLNAQGRRLGRDTGALARELSARRTHVPLADAVSPRGAGLLAAFMNGVEQAGASTAAERYATKMSGLLSGRGGVRLLKGLPPFAIASLIPADRLFAFATPGARASGVPGGPAKDDAKSPFPEATSYITMGLAAATYALDKLRSQIVTALVTHPYFVGNLPQQLVTELNILIRNTVGWRLVGAGLVGVQAGNVIAGPIAGFFTGQRLVDEAAKVIGKFWPTALAVAPAQATVDPGQAQEYSVDAIDQAGRNVGPPIFGFRLEISSGGACAGSSCTADTPGSYLVTARNGEAEGTARLRVKVNLQIEPMTLPDAAVGEEFQQQLVATGAGPGTLHWSVLSGPPAAGGWRITDAGLLSGVPEEAGASTIRVEVRDDAGNSATQEFSLTVVGPPEISTTALDSAIPGVYDSQVLQLSGGLGPYTWSIASGSLPPGVTLGESTGAISGAPSFGSAAERAALLHPFVFEVAVEDKYGARDNQELTLTVEPPPCSGSPCAVASRFGQVTLAWSSCGCAYFPSGPYAYDAAVYVDGAFVAFERFWDATTIGTGERNWLTQGFAGGANFKPGQVVSYILYRYRSSPEERVSLGSSNSVVVK